MPGPARFQRRGDPANNGVRDVGHKLARPIDAFARSLHRVGNVGAVHHASAVEAALGTEHATSFVVNADQFPATALWLLRECYFLSYGAIELYRAMIDAYQALSRPSLPRRRRQPPRGHEAHAVTWREFVGQEAVRQ
jgi:hypothetical protein